MKTKSILLIAICVLLTACNVKINTIHGLIKITQNDIIIEHETGIFDFGSISVNEFSLELLFKIENRGLTQLNLTGTPIINISGADSSMFIVKQSMTFSEVSSHNLTKFTIKFNPTSTGLKSATISIANSDSERNPYIFKVTGKGVTPEINVKQGSTDIPNNTGIYDFGKFSVNQSSSDITFTVENLGTSSLSLTGTPKIRISGSDASMFTINQTMTVSSVAPGFSTTFTITFIPASEGIKSSVISITNDDSDEDPYIFKVIGKCRPYYCWTKRLGGFSNQSGCSVTTDKSGNIYVTGPFSGTADFGSDFGSSDIKTSAGTTDIFVSKINANGTYGWTKRMGGINYDEPYSIATDSAGNVFITGRFTRTVNFGEDFGASDSKSSSNNSSDVFVTKINANGTYGWTRQIGDSSNDYGLSITTDSSRNIYLTGYFSGAVNFGADFEVSDHKLSSGDCDIFVLKINANGTYGWAKRIGGYYSDYGLSITTDSSSNIYLTGSFGSYVNFGMDFGVTDNKACAGNSDIFITKINANGTYGWTKRMGTLGSQQGISITTDSSDNIYITGNFSGVVNFGDDFGIIDVKMTYSGSSETFVMKINANRSYGWTKHIKVKNCFSITTNSSGDIFVTGGFSYTVNFGEDFGISDIKTSGSQYDVFVTKIKANGNYDWTKRMGSASYDSGYSVTADTSDYLYISGFFRDTVNFGEDFGETDIKTSTSSSQVFVTKICP